MVVLALGLSVGCDDPDLRNTPPPGAQVDSFVQDSAAKIDVLWVIDNSPTMERQLQNVADNFHRFFESLVLSDADFHVAVTTTDVINDHGSLVGTPAVISRNTPDPVGAFAKNIRVGTGGNAWEQGLEAARRTLELHRAGFIRDDAYFFLVFVSDEDDQSDLGDPYHFYRYFKGSKGKGNEGMISAGAIVGDVPDGCFSEFGRGEPGERYHEFIALMGGHIGSICDPNFAQILHEMGMDAVGLRRKYPLTELPDLDDLEVQVRLPCDSTEEVLSLACESTESRCGSSSGAHILCTVREKQESGRNGYTYELATNSIVLHGHAIPPRGSVVEIVYMEAKE